MNSDCNNPLSCTYGRCHVTCDENRDCDPGQLCAGPPGAGVCLLPEEETCGLNSDCPDQLFCAIDLKCRTQCQNERDCTTATQRCVPSVSDANIKVCAEPEELEDDALTPPADAGVSPDAGASPDAGVSPDAGGNAMDAAAPDAGADGPVGPGADGGGVGDGGDGGDAGGSEAGGMEIEPNEDRDHATPYTPGTTVIASVGGTDVDFYEMVAPAGDLSGGYYQASITDVGTGAIRAVVYTATDNGMIHQVSTSTQGGSLFFYWAAAPAQKYRIAINGSANASAPYKYTFQIQYTRVNDTFEPNDTRDVDASKMLTLGTPITAYYFTGYKSMTINVPDYQDWFALDLAAGMATVKIDNPITNWRPMFEIIDALGNPLSDAREVASTAGASIDHPFMVTTAGKYRAVIQGYGNQAVDEADNGTTLPDNFTRPYTLTISQ
jgi:hypothetical protein